MPLVVAVAFRKLRFLKLKAYVGFSAGSSMNGIEEPVRVRPNVWVITKMTCPSRQCLPALPIPEDNEDLSPTGALTEEAEESSMTCIICWRLANAATLRLEVYPMLDFKRSK